MVLLRTRRNLLNALLSKYIEAFLGIFTFKLLGKKILFLFMALEIPPLINH